MVNESDYRELVRQVAYEQAKLSSSAFFVSGDDHLRVRTFGSLASVTVSLELRFLGADGRLNAWAETHTPNSDRTEATSLHTLGEGFLLTAQLRASVGAPRVGQLFAVVDIIRGRTGAVIPIATLLQGYVTSSSRLAWPGSPMRDSVDGPGVIRSITGTNPAAGAEWQETVPTNARWRFHSLVARLVTDATVANRSLLVTFDDGATVVAMAGANNSQAASLTVDWALIAGAVGATSAGNQRFLTHTPGLMLAGGFRINSVTLNLQAGDNWAAPQFLVEEWIED